jgi:hypothetical protein
MQMTDVLRDVVADLRNDRVYFPADELVRFGYSSEALLEAACKQRPLDSKVAGLRHHLVSFHNRHNFGTFQELANHQCCCGAFSCGAYQLFSAALTRVSRGEYI